MGKNFLISLKYLVISTLFFGFIYTFAITGVGYVFFKNKVKGSLIENNGTVIGSRLIQQNFSDPKFFWGRPSASNFETMPSGASNYGAISKDLKKNVDDRVNNIKKFYPNIKIEDIPPELLLASGSGLDPHISLNTALFQVDRIMKARKLPKIKREVILTLINKHTRKIQIDFLGEPRVNVLGLNIEMEKVLNGK
ncbi:MAG: potassium-transporting ATPase subunit KdpC [Proteobacteria bacterium]|nr:potassium-transporting ATPase subunit KdpC [Pseudomonadota bacterium]